MPFFLWRFPPASISALSNSGAIMDCERLFITVLPGVIAALLLPLLLSACGGGNSGGGGSSSAPAPAQSVTNAPASPPGLAPNAAAVAVDFGVIGVQNVLSVSVTVCAPGTTQCQTID